MTRFSPFFTPTLSRNQLLVLLTLGFSLGLFAALSNFFLLLIVVIPLAVWGLLMVGTNPWLSIFLIVVLSPLDDLQRLPGLPNVSLTKAIGVLALIIWLDAIIRKKRPFRLSRVGLPFTILLFLVAITGNYPVSFSPLISLGSYLFLFLIITHLIDDKKQLQVILRFFLLVAGVVSLLAIIQYFTGQTIINTLSPDSLAIGRTIGTDDNPNAGAVIPLLGLPLIIAFLSQRQSWLWQSLFATAGLFMVGHLILSFSRGAWVGAFLGVALVLFFSGATRIARLMFVIGIMASLVLFLDIEIPVEAIQNRLDKMTTEQALEGEGRRSQLYEAYPLFVADHWLFGVGVGANNFKNNIARYAGFTIAPHSSFFAVLAGAGLPALLVYLWLFIELTLQTLRRLRLPGLTDGYLAAGMLGSIIGFQIHSLFHTYLYWFIGWMMVALLVVYNQLSVPNSSQTTPLTLRQ